MKTMILPALILALFTLPSAHAADSTINSVAQHAGTAAIGAGAGCVVGIAYGAYFTGGNKEGMQSGCLVGSMIGAAGGLVYEPEAASAAENPPVDETQLNNSNSEE